MAIDRTKAYYKEWTNDVGWNMRFEIIPAGDSQDDAQNMKVVTFEAIERGAISIKTHKISFDKLPFGTKQPDVLEVDFIFSDLQSNLKEMIKNPFYSQTYGGLEWNTTNLFVLKSDRGEGFKDNPSISANMYIEFIGGQRATLSNKYELRKDIATGDFITDKVTIEALDLYKLVCEQIPMTEFAKHVFARNDLYPQEGNVYVNLDLYIPSGYYVTGIVNQNTTADRMWFASVSTIFSTAISVMVSRYMSFWSRVKIEDFEANCFGNLFEAITYYRQDETKDHATGTSLGYADLLGMVKTNSQYDADELKGGMLVEDKNGESYLEFKYLWDLLKVITEEECAKHSYRPFNATITSERRYSYLILFNKIFANPANIVPDLRDRFADAQQGNIPFVPCSNVIRSATSEIPNMTKPDAVRYIAESTGTRSDDKINVKLIHHNIGTSNFAIAGGHYFYERRIYPRKLYYFNSGNPLAPYIKVHESVSIDDGLNETLYSDILPLPSISGGAEIAKVQAWAVATQQQNGKHVAVANFYLDRFSNAAQNEIPVTMFMKNSETMPENIGDLCLIPTIDDFEGTGTASIIEAEANWQTGTINLTFISRGV